MIKYYEDDTNKIPDYINNLSPKELKKAIYYLENKEKIRLQKCVNMTESEKNLSFEEAENNYENYLKELSVK